tara:strand:+ start:145 stop:621 length:477 start_codon:yes stop_codon:yes gene_type:complete
MKLLPPECPELVLDYRAELVLNLVKSTPALVLNWSSPGRPYINATMLPSLEGAQPCVLHANSASKSALPVLQLYAERMGHSTRTRRMQPVPTDEELVEKVNTWQSVSPCQQRIPPGGLRKPAVCLGTSRRYLRDLTALEPSAYKVPQVKNKKEQSGSG